MQNLEEHYGTILTVFLTWLTTSFSNFFFGRKREQKEIERANLEIRSSQVDLVDKISNLMARNTDIYETKLSELRAEMDGIREEQSKLKDENRGLKSENSRLKNQVESLSKRIKELEATHG